MKADPKHIGRYIRAFGWNWKIISINYLGDYDIERWEHREDDLYRIEGSCILGLPEDHGHFAELIESEYVVNETLKSAGAPVPSTPKSEGFGECLKYGGDFYFYRVGKWLPKDKISILRSEGNYCGRVHGEVQHIIVAPKDGGYVLLDHVYTFGSSSGVRRRMADFKGMTPDEAIAKVEQEEQERQAIIDTRIECDQCGKGVLVFENDQPDDLCLECYYKKIGKPYGKKKKKV